MNSDRGQPRLFDPPSPGRADLPPPTGEEFASPAQEELVIAVWRCAKDRVEFTAEDAWVYVPVAAADQISDRRLMGSALQYAERSDWVAATRRRARSAHSEANARPRSVWRSLICDGTSADAASNAASAAQSAQAYELLSGLPVELVVEVSHALSAATARGRTTAGGQVAAIRLGWMSSCRAQSLRPDDLANNGWDPKRITDEVSAKRLVAIRDGHRWLLPRWQFNDDLSQPMVGVAELLANWRASTVALHAWMVRPNASLGGKAPHRTLASGVAAVIAVLPGI